MSSGSLPPHRIATEADALAELLGDVKPEFVSPAAREIRPWHKPRKHWIREHQWQMNCEMLIQQHLRGELEFKYLSLPGPDLLDVRFVSGMCLRLGKVLRFLGFNNPMDERPDDVGLLSKGVAEICQSEHVNSNSTVVPDRLENLATERSVANRIVTEFGSFDAINLDLCNSVAGHVPLDQQSTYYDAIHALFEHQKTTRTKPFLLFLTTQTERGTMKTSAVARLARAVKKNLQNPDFSARLSREQRIQAFEVHQLVDAAKWPAGWGQRKISSFVTLAISKWLLSLLWEGEPSWYLDVLDSCEYKVFAERDMLSISILCSPVRRATADNNKLSKHKPNLGEAPSERQCAMRLLEKLASTFDLDAKLRADPEYSSLLERAARLMESAGYDSREYKSRFAAAL